VHRCTSELCGFRQRRARWAQKLKSLTQRKTFEVVEHLRRQGCGETQLQTESLEEFCKEGARECTEELCCEFKKKTESLRSSVKLCQVGIELVQGVHRRRTLL
jgi:hypothetical protein